MAILFFCLMAIQNSKQNIEYLATKCGGKKENTPITSKYLNTMRVSNYGAIICLYLYITSVPNSVVTAGPTPNAMP